MPTWLVGQADTLVGVAGKALLMYGTAVVGLRIAHRRTLSQWTAIDFAAAVAIGAVMGRTAVAEGQSFIVGAVALLTFLAAHALVTLGRSNRWLAKAVDTGSAYWSTTAGCAKTSYASAASPRMTCSPSSASSASTSWPSSATPSTRRKESSPSCWRTAPTPMAHSCGPGWPMPRDSFPAARRRRPDDGHDHPGGWRSPRGSRRRSPV